MLFLLYSLVQFNFWFSFRGEKCLSWAVPLDLYLTFIKSRMPEKIRNSNKRLCKCICRCIARGGQSIVCRLCHRQVCARYCWNEEEGICHCCAATDIDSLGLMVQVSAAGLQYAMGFVDMARFCCRY